MHLEEQDRGRVPDNYRQFVWRTDSQPAPKALIMGSGTAGSKIGHLLRDRGSRTRGGLVPPTNSLWDGMTGASPSEYADRPSVGTMCRFAT